MMDTTQNGRLTDDEIVNLIKDYVDEDLYNYSIMIDGEWGCGKTYFVKNCLQAKLEEHEKDKAKKQCSYKEKRIIYLSLYGVKSVVEVSKQVLMEAYFIKAGKTKGYLKKGTDVMLTMLPVAFDILKPFASGIELEPEEVTNIFGKFLSVKDSILIFDDLERCNCPINEILAYMNTFVEHENMKVIIVANQKEIGKNSYLKNQELKYLVASNENIEFEKKPKRDYLFACNIEAKPKEKIKEPLEVEELEARADMLFGQDLLYRKIKEKIVGITVCYYPKLRSIFDKLIKNDMIDSKLQNYLLEQVAFFEKYMMETEHPNIRTFQFYLSKIQGIYKLIAQNDSQVQEAFLKHIIKYCFMICVAYKTGTIQYNWEGNEMFGFKAIRKTDLFGNNLAFRFVDDYVIKSVLYEDTIQKMIAVYENEYSKEHNQEIEFLRNFEFTWYLSSDIEVEKKLAEVIQALEDDKYKIKEYARIIKLLVQLEQVGFSKVYTEQVILKMTKHIKNARSYFNLNNGYYAGDDEHIKQRYRVLISNLQKEIDQQFSIKVAERMEKYLLLEEGWAKKLAEYVINRQTEIRSENGFLYKINIQELVQKIENAKSYEIQDFRKCINSLYINNSIGKLLKKDEEKISELITELQKMDKTSFDKIKKMQLKYLIENLQSAELTYKNNYLHI